MSRRRIATLAVLGAPLIASAASGQAVMANAGSEGANPVLIGMLFVGGTAILQGISVAYTLFATRREMEAMKTEVDRRFKAIEERQTTGEVRMDDHIAVLHEKVNRVDRAVSAVETETRIQTKALERIELALTTRGVETRPSPTC